MTARTPIDFWREISRVLEEGVACALATVVETRGSVPRPAGAHLLLRADGGTVGTVGGGALELAVLEAAQLVLKEGEPRLLSYQLKPDLGMTCGGAAQVFVEPLLPADRLYIFGAGHICQALAPLAAGLGFRVTVIDQRRELAAASVIPSAAGFLHSYQASDWGSLIFDDRTYCVVVTPSHRYDTQIAVELLRRPARYVGMIGSKRKRATAEEALRAGGIGEDRIARLRTPIGEPIDAETPAEIAVSIAAELVRYRRGLERTLHASPASDSREEQTMAPKLIDTLLLLALPASGKSEVRKYLSGLTPDQCRNDFRMGPTVQLDDFPYVHVMRRIDEELAKLAEDSIFFQRGDRPFRDPIEWGTLIELVNEDFADLIARRKITPPSHANHLLERLERARAKVGGPAKLSKLGDEIRKKLAAALEAEARDLQQKKEAEYPASLDGKTIVIEFARGGADGSSFPLPAPFGYEYSLSRLSEEILARSSVLYIWVTPEESRRKNDARADPNDPGSILHHGVPLEVMMKDYGCDDMEYLLGCSGKPDTIKIAAHGKTFLLPVARFDNRVDKTSFVRNDRARWTPAEIEALHQGLAQGFSRLAPR